MKLVKYQRKAKTVFVKWKEPSKQGGDDVKTDESPQAPLDELENAIQCLKDVCASVMELPLSWMETVIIRGIKVSYTTAGTRSVEINGTKALRCEKVEAFKTPVFQIDPPDESEDEPRACTTEEAIAICRVIDAAEAYIQGERKDSDCEGITHTFGDPNQNELPLDGDDDDVE